MRQKAVLEVEAEPLPKKQSGFWEWIKQAF